MTANFSLIVQTLPHSNDVLIFIVLFLFFFVQVVIFLVHRCTGHFPNLYKSMYNQEREVNYLMSSCLCLFVLLDIACQKIDQQFTSVGISED